MRAELHAQHRKALAAARQVMTSEHHSAQERLRSNIAKREEQAAQNVAALEAATYNERQKLLGELDALRRRENDAAAAAEIKRRAEREAEAETRRAAEALEKRRDQLERREMELDRLKQEYRASATREVTERFRSQFDQLEKSQALCAQEQAAARAARESVAHVVSRLNDAEKEVAHLRSKDGGGEGTNSLLRASLNTTRRGEDDLDVTFNSLEVGRDGETHEGGTQTGASLIGSNAIERGTDVAVSTTSSKTIRGVLSGVGTPRASDRLSTHHSTNVGTSSQRHSATLPEDIAVVNAALAREATAHRDEIASLEREARRNEVALRDEVIALRHELRIAQNEGSSEKRQRAQLESDNDSLREQLSALNALLQNQARALHVAARAQPRSTLSSSSSITAAVASRSPPVRTNMKDVAEGTKTQEPISVANAVATSLLVQREIKDLKSMIESLRDSHDGERSNGGRGGDRNSHAPPVFMHPMAWPQYHYTTALATPHGTLPQPVAPPLPTGMPPLPPAVPKSSQHQLQSTQLQQVPPLQPSPESDSSLRGVTSTTSNTKLEKAETNDPKATTTAEREVVAAKAEAELEIQRVRLEAEKANLLLETEREQLKLARERNNMKIAEARASNAAAATALENAERENATALQQAMDTKFKEQQAELQRQLEAMQQVESEAIAAAKEREQEATSVVLEMQQQLAQQQTNVIASKPAVLEVLEESREDGDTTNVTSEAFKASVVDVKIQAGKVSTILVAGEVMVEEKTSSVEADISSTASGNADSTKDASDSISPQIESDLSNLPTVSQQRDVEAEQAARRKAKEEELALREEKRMAEKRRIAQEREAARAAARAERLATEEQKKRESEKIEREEALRKEQEEEAKELRRKEEIQSATDAQADEELNKVQNALGDKFEQVRARRAAEKEKKEAEAARQDGLIDDQDRSSCSYTGEDSFDPEEVC